MQMVPCRLSHVLLEEHTARQAIFLSEIGGERRMSIVIGPFEAEAINRVVHQEQFPRPLTHDLLLQVVARSGYHLSEVRIVALHEGTYHAEIALTPAQGGAELLIDCRPSDAVALLVRSPGTTLAVAEDLLEVDE